MINALFLPGMAMRRLMSRVSGAQVCVLLFGLAFTACTWLKPQPFSPLPPVARDDLSPAQIHSLLDQRTPQFDTLWAHMKIYISGRNIKGKKFFEATLLYEAPNERLLHEESWAGKLRLRGYRTLSPTLFECLVLPDRLQVYLNAEQELYSGSQQTLRNNPSLFFGVNPADIARALEIERTVARLLQEGNLEAAGRGAQERPRAMTSRSAVARNRLATLPGHYVFIQTRTDNAKQVFVMRKTDLLVDRVALYDPGNRLAVEVTYYHYDLFDGHVLPTKMTVRFIQSQATMTARILEYKINPPLQPAVFEFTLPAAVRELPLEELVKWTS